MFDLRVEKERSQVTLTLSNGTLVHGSAFVAAGCASHQGPECIKDLLNAEVQLLLNSSVKVSEVTARVANDAAQKINVATKEQARKTA